MRVCTVCRRCYSDVEAACVDQLHTELIDVPERGINMVPGYRIERSIKGPTRVEKYLAIQSDTNAECVINVAPLNGGDSQAFLADAKAAATMFHPNIVNLYGSGVLENGDPYFISEAPRAGTLRDLLNDGIPPLLTTIEIIRETAEAVHAMHTVGLVHGALRPENIAVADDPSVEHRVKILDPDFGGAFCHSIISNKLTIDSALDVLRYFAPEQFSPDAATPQADVYGLGTLLFEMLAGEPPFDGENASELIEKIRNEHPADITINNFDLRMLLTHTLMQALQKQPAFRQPTALAFARQLRHMEQLATHSATPPVPFPGAIPQKQAAAAAAAAGAGTPATTSKPPAPARRKNVEITDVKKLGIQALKKREEMKAGPAEIKLVEPAALVSAEDRTQAETTGDLNKSRLQNWKERYQAVSSAFRTESKSGLQQLSLSEQPTPKAKAAAEIEPNSTEMVEAPGPARIKIEWDEAADDLPSLDDVRKVQAEGPAASLGGAEITAEPAIEHDHPSPPRRARTVAAHAQSFGNFLKLARVKKRASAERETGMFSGMVPITGVSMNRLIIAGGFTVAVILGLFFGSSLLESNDVQSAATETQETKIVPQVVSEPVRKEPKVSDSETDEAVTETPDVASKGSTDVASFALPKPSKSTEKETDPDQAPEPQRKVSNSSTAQAANKPAAAKSAPKPALTPSTLVISPGNGKVKAKVEPGNGSAFTRPRVVANPKP